MRKIAQKFLVSRIVLMVLFNGIARSLSGMENIGAGAERFLHHAGDELNHLTVRVQNKEQESITYAQSLHVSAKKFHDSPGWWLYGNVVGLGSSMLEVGCSLGGVRWSDVQSLVSHPMRSYALLALHHIPLWYTHGISNPFEALAPFVGIGIFLEVTGKAREYPVGVSLGLVGTGLQHGIPSTLQWSRIIPACLTGGSVIYTLASQGQNKDLGHVCIAASAMVGAACGLVKSESILKKISYGAALIGSGIITYARCVS